jgi:hypothetical protein
MAEEANYAARVAMLTLWRASVGRKITLHLAERQVGPPWPTRPLPPPALPPCVRSRQINDARSRRSRTVSGTLLAVDAAVSELVVADLATPFGVYPTARIRGSDVFCLEVMDESMSAAAHASVADSGAKGAT